MKRLLLTMALAAGLAHGQGSGPLHPATYVTAGWAQTTGGQGGKPGQDRKAG